MTKFSRVLILFFLLCSFPLVYANQKIGFVNQAKLLQEAPQAESARKKLQKEFSGRDKSLVSLQNKIKSNTDKLEKDAAVLSSTELNKLKRKITLLRRDLDRDQMAFKEDLTIRQNEELVKLQKSVLDAILKIAEQQKFDLIVGDGVIYASKQVDITDKILAELKKQLKSKK